MAPSSQEKKCEIMYCGLYFNDLCENGVDLHERFVQKPNPRLFGKVTSREVSGFRDSANLQGL
jgi:hypothetical protein